MAGKTTEVMNDDAALAKELSTEAETKDAKNVEEEESLEDDANAPPLHLHAMRIPARLQGSSTHVRSRSSSRSRPSSRSASPVPSSNISKGGSVGGGSGMGTPTPSGDNLSDCAVTSISSASSLDGNASERSLNTLDPDILTDQKGFVEMEPPPPHEIATGALASPGLHNFLPPVSERLSEETLDDCHAFSDVVVSLPRSRPSSVCGGSLVGNESILLETLDECFEEEEEDDEENDDDEKKEKKAPASSSVDAEKDVVVSDETPPSHATETQLKKRLFDGKAGEPKKRELSADDLIERLDHIQVEEQGDSVPR